MNHLNIILIIIDSLRKDYSTFLKDKLDKLGFISYENAIAPASWTTPSHASIFLGVYPISHGAHETRKKKSLNVKLRVNRNILSLILSNLGYKTYLFTANPYITPNFGFIGFNQIYQYNSSGCFPIRTKSEIKFLREFKKKFNIEGWLSTFKLLLMKGHFKIAFKSIYDRVIEPKIRFLIRIMKNWPLDKGAKYIAKKLRKSLYSLNNNSPFFIFINLMEAHEPYSLLNEKYSKELYLDNLRFNKSIKECARQWRRSYPRAVKYVSHRIIEIMDVLMENNAFDNSLIIVTSDHGQLLGEHGRIGHGTFLYDELLRVPLFIKYPKNIRIKFHNRSTEYISLVNLKSLILNFMRKNEIISDNILFSDTVFSESYGIHISYDEKYSDELRKYEKYRIAIYSGELKGIFNVEDWDFETIQSYNEYARGEEDDINILKMKIVKFLRKAIMLKFSRN